MPAPDVCYFLDCSVSAGHIGGDTHFYYMQIADDSNEVLDGYEDRREFERHWNRLVDMGLYLENRFVTWRAQNRRDAKMASLMGLHSLPWVMQEMIDSCAHELVQKEFHSLDQKGLAHLQQRYEFITATEIMRRSLKRAAVDLGDFGPAQMRAIRDDVDALYQRQTIARNEAMARIVRDHREGDTGEVDRRRAQQYVRDEMKSQRKVIKRSIKFLNKLVGNDTTRMFVGGDVIRFEGQYAIYEMKRTGSIHQAHGGARLSVFSKEHDLHLCDVCIYTPKVPLLDHVASIALHIRAGEEDKILDIGNPYNINDRAYEHQWLIPHLPKQYVPEPRVPRDPTEPIELNLGGDRRIVVHPDFAFPEIKNLKEKLHKAKQAVGRYLYEEVLSDHVGLITTAKLLASETR